MQEEWKLSPPSEPIRKRNTPLIVGSILGIVVLGGVGLYFADKAAVAKKEKAFEDGWSKLSSCLIGQPPKSPEDAVATVRGIQLRVASEADVGGGSWPVRCVTYADSLYSTLLANRHVSQKNDDFAAAVSQLKGTLASADVKARLGDYSTDIENAYQRASAEHIGLHFDDSVAPAPKPALPALRLAELRTHKPLAKKPLPRTSIKRETHVYSDLAFLIDDKTIEGAPMLCTASDEQAVIECEKVPSSVLETGGVLQLGAEREAGAKPLLMLGHHASRGLFTADGKLVFKGQKFGWGYAKKDGSTLALSYTDAYFKGGKGQLQLSAMAADGSSQQTMVDPPDYVAKNENLYYAAFLGPGWVGWYGYDKEGTSIRLMMQSVIDRPVGVSAVTDLGEVGERVQTEETWRTCVRGDTEAFLLQASPGYWITVKKDGKWGAPAKGGGFGSVACYGGAVTYTAAGDESATQSICKYGSCESHTVDLPACKGRLAADLEGRVLTIGRPHERGGVQMQVAPLVDLPKSAWTVLFDEWFDGKPLKESWVKELTLLPLPKSAVLLVSTNDGTFAVSINRDGKPVPLDVVQKPSKG